MFLTVDVQGSEPLYIQIRNQIVAGIARGELEEGQTLPSVRKLGSDLGVNLHTVNKAYALLQDEGYVRIRGRAGTVVVRHEGIDAEQRNKLDRRYADELNQLALEYLACGGCAQDFLALAADAVQSVEQEKLLRAEGE